MINEANKRKVKSIFSSDQSTIWRIPPYQREYSWEKNKECEELFNDIVEIAEEENDYHFIGSMITYTPEGEDEKQVVDGQQRTVTLSFFYLSLYKFLNELKTLSETESFDDAIQRIENKFINNDNEERRPKFILSSQKRNHLDFKSILDENNLIHLTASEKKSNPRVGNRKFYQTYVYISNFIQTYIQNEVVYEEKKCFEEMKNILKSLNDELTKKRDFQSLEIVLNILALIDPEYDTSNNMYIKYEGTLAKAYNDLRKKNEDKLYPKFEQDSSFFVHFKKLLDDFNQASLTVSDSYLSLLKEVDQNITSKSSFKSFFTNLEYRVIKNLIQTIDETLIVLIDVKSLRSANNIFETINNRGRPLLPMDLLKNKILAYIDDMKDEYVDRNRIVEKYQIFMDNSDKQVSDHVVMQGTVGTWSAMIEPLSENDQISFLRRYYIAFNDSYEVAYKKPTKNNILEIFEKMINKENAIDVLKDLYEKSLKYRELISTSSEYTNLAYLNVTPSYSLLLYLEVISDRIDNYEILRKKVIYIIEKFFVRRHLTNYPTINKLDDLFKRIIDEIKAISGEKVKYIDIYKRIVENITINEYWDSDENVNELLSGDIYLRHSELTKYLLVHLDKELSTANSRESNPPFYWKRVKKQPLFSVEHILPQQTTGTLDNDWVTSLLDRDKNYTPTDEDIEKASKLKDMYCHKLGNLTLTGYNSSLSDKPFIIKRDKQNDGKKFIGFKNGLALNESIAQKEKWTTTDIDDRTRKLVEILQKNLFNSSFDIN